MAIGVSKDFQGHVALKDITAAGSQIILPSSTARPRNPQNNVYMPCINASAYPSIVVLGQKTPSIQVASYAKRSWFTATLLNHLLLTQDTEGDTNDFAIGLYDKQQGVYRVFDWGKCTQVDITGGPSGVQSVNMAFENIYGDSEAIPAAHTQHTATTFSSTGVVPDPGQLVNVSQVTWSGGMAARIRSYRLTLLRGQMAQHFMDGTFYAADISSGMFSGVLTIEQEPNATSVPTSGVTLTIDKVQIVMALNLDEHIRNFDPTFGTMSNTFSLISLSDGGNPCVITQLA